MFNSPQKPQNKFEKRREIVFLLFSGIFIGTLASQLVDSLTVVLITLSNAIRVPEQYSTS